MRTGAPAVAALRTRRTGWSGATPPGPPVPDSEFVMPADAVVWRFGFHPHGMWKQIAWREGG